MTQTLDEDKCWQAVESRTLLPDTPFFYGVRSTGVYCRPSCPARRPRRSQVQFFAGPDAAEAAGFRACLRCRPRETAAPAETVEAVCRYIETHLDEVLNLATLSAQAGLSQSHLQRVFRRTAGVSPREYAAACRSECFKAQLQNGEPVMSALVEAGYGSTSRLYAQPPLGMTPTEYKRGGKHMAVTYALTDTPLGRMLVAATAKGVCAVTLGDTDTELQAALTQEFPSATLTQDNSGLAEWVQMLVQHLAGEQPHLDLPLDVRATAFQRRVWRELQAIPSGETRSYTQVAEAVGSPGGARAVASACASNPVALAVPCHRVVRGDGSLSGYRWGTQRKQALLEREKSEAREFPPAPNNGGA